MEEILRAEAEVCESSTADPEASKLDVRVDGKERLRLRMVITPLESEFLRLVKVVDCGEAVEPLAESFICVAEIP